MAPSLAALLLLALAAPAAPARVAVCITGVLRRLELASKLEHVAAPLAAAGHTVAFLLHLDPGPAAASAVLVTAVRSRSAVPPGSAVEAVSEGPEGAKFPYAAFQSGQLLRAVDVQLRGRGLAGVAWARVGYSSPESHRFELQPESSPELGPAPAPLPPDSPEAARARARRSLRLGRACARMVTTDEIGLGIHFDFVLRVKEDSLFFAPVALDVTSLNTSVGILPEAHWLDDAGARNVVSDHAFLVPRRWLEPMMRGVVEDFYFDEAAGSNSWTAAGQLLWLAAAAKGVPLLRLPPCALPLVPLRGLAPAGDTWWLNELHLRRLLRSLADPGAACGTAARALAEARTAPVVGLDARARDIRRTVVGKGEGAFVKVMEDNSRRDFWVGEG